MTLDISWARGAGLVHRVERLSRSVYSFREETSLAVRLLLVVGFAGFTGLSAQVSFPLPFTPVPVTGQVFAVLVSSSVLGRWLGPASQAVYLTVGAAGVPWFAPTGGAGPFTSGGWEAIVGASGGYLIGFLVASVVVGRLLDRGFRERSFSANLLVLLLGVGLIYAIGSTQLALLLGLSASNALLYGAVPFLPGDVLKAAAAAGVLVLALPRGGPAGVGSVPARPALRWSDAPSVVGVLAVVWGTAVVVGFSGGIPAPLVAYYLLSAGALTAVTVSAFGLRRARGRPGPVDATQGTG